MSRKFSENSELPSGIMLNPDKNNESKFIEDVTSIFNVSASSE